MGAERFPSVDFGLFLASVAQEGLVNSRYISSLSLEKALNESSPINVRRYRSSIESEFDLTSDGSSVVSNDMGDMGEHEETDEERNRLALEECIENDLRKLFPKVKEKIEAYFRQHELTINTISDIPAHLQSDKAINAAFQLQTYLKMFDQYTQPTFIDCLVLIERMNQVKDSLSSGFSAFHSKSRKTLLNTTLILTTRRRYGDPLRRNKAAAENSALNKNLLALDKIINEERKANGFFQKLFRRTNAFFQSVFPKLFGARVNSSADKLIQSEFDKVTSNSVSTAVSSTQTSEAVEPPNDVVPEQADSDVDSIAVNDTSHFGISPPASDPIRKSPSCFNLFSYAASQVSVSGNSENVSEDDGNDPELAAIGDWVIPAASEKSRPKSALGIGFVANMAHHEPSRTVNTRPETICHDFRPVFAA